MEPHTFGFGSLPERVCGSEFMMLGLVEAVPITSAVKPTLQNGAHACPCHLPRLVCLLTAQAVSLRRALSGYVPSSA